MMKASAQWGCLGVGGGLGEEDTSLSRRVQADVAWLWGCPLPWPGGGGAAGSQQRPPDGFCLLGGAPASTAGELGQVGHPKVG